HREGVRAPRAGHAHRRRAGAAELPGDPGLRAGRRAADGRRQPGRGSPVRARRPEDPPVMKRPATWLGSLLLVVFLGAALLGPSLAPYSPTRADLDQRLLGPSAAHPFGTDENGVDLLSETLWGARVALLISASVVGICALVGVALGTIAGYLGGWVDEL